MGLDMLGENGLTTEELASRCAADGEFRLAARHWTGGLRLESPETEIGLSVVDGELRRNVPAAGQPGVVVLKAAAEVWAKFLLALVGLEPGVPVAELAHGLESRLQQHLSSALLDGSEGATPYWKVGPLQSIG